VTKRLMDIALSAAALLVLALPLAVVALILRFTGEKEVWFLQDRLGLHGKLFKVIKFATMRKDSEYTGTKDITLRNDPRVLPFGRFLRRRKINELPQLINVLKGDMSVVGWRPLLVKSFSYYPEHVQKQIINMKPGLTGVGSIIFRDEESIVAKANKSPERVYAEDIAPYKGELELWYQRNQSLWLDVKIITLTAWTLMNRRSRIYDKLLPGLPERPESLK